MTDTYPPEYSDPYKRTPTDIAEWKFGDDIVRLEIINTSARFAWRLLVNGLTNDDEPDGCWHGGNSNLLTNGAYAIASDYWQGYLPTMQPFRMVSLGMPFNVVATTDLGESLKP